LVKDHYSLDIMTDTSNSQMMKLELPPVEHKTACSVYIYSNLLTTCKILWFKLLGSWTPCSVLFSNDEYKI